MGSVKIVIHTNICYHSNFKFEEHSHLNRNILKNFDKSHYKVIVVIKSKKGIIIRNREIVIGIKIYKS